LFYKTVDDVPAQVEYVDATFAQKGCISRLNILSHGGKLVDASTGTEIGSTITIGKQGESIRSDDFDPAGNLTNSANAQATKSLLDALKRVLCRGAKRFFSACNQGTGELLRDISRYLDNDVEVNGFSGLGNPVTSGDRTYVNGERR